MIFIVNESYKIDVKNLRYAKVVATLQKRFYESILSIHNENGLLLSTKIDGKWFDEIEIGDKKGSDEGVYRTAERPKMKGFMIK